MKEITSKKTFNCWIVFLAVWAIKRKDVFGVVNTGRVTASNPLFKHSYFFFMAIHGTRCRRCGF